MKKKKKENPPSNTAKAIYNWHMTPPRPLASKECCPQTYNGHGYPQMRMKKVGR